MEVEWIATAVLDQVEGCLDSWLLVLDFLDDAFEQGKPKEPGATKRSSYSGCIVRLQVSRPCRAAVLPLQAHFRVEGFLPLQAHFRVEGFLPLQAHS
jgi:hypothetical protein